MQLIWKSRRSRFLLLVLVSFVLVSLFLVHSASRMGQPFPPLHFRSIAPLRPIHSLNITFQNDSSATHVPELNRTSQGYVLSVRYADQHSNALLRLLSMQCWAGTLNLSVVEPFVLGNSKLGIGEFHRDFKSDPSILRLSDVYDINHWNTKAQQIVSGNHSVLVNWNKFLLTAPRRLVMVEIRYKTVVKEKCTFQDFTGWPEFFQQYGFFTVRKECIHLNPRHPIMQTDFNSRIYPDALINEVTILFNDWKGIKHNTAQYNDIGLIDSKCTIGSGYNWVAELNPAVYGNASHYINEYLGGTEYVSVMLRTERLVIRGLEQTFDKCFNATVNAWKAVTHEIESVNTFVTSDVGLFGSQTILSQSNPLLMYKFLQSVLSTLLINESTLQTKQRELMETAGTTNPAFIALIEKAIAVQARCLVLVGSGRFQKHAAELYQSLHHVEEQCIVQYSFCNPVLVIPPYLRKML